MKLTTENFKLICGLNGLTPSQVCARIKRHKTTVYRALRKPSHFGPTFELLNESLPVRSVGR